MYTFFNLLFSLCNHFKSIAPKLVPIVTSGRGLLHYQFNVAKGFQPCMFIVIFLFSLSTVSYAALNITKITTNSANVTAGSSGEVVKMTVTNTGTFDVIVDTANTKLSFKQSSTDVGQHFTATLSPTGPLILKRGGDTDVEFSVNVLSTANTLTGAITIDGSVSGRDNLIRNGGFEESSTTPPTAWNEWQAPDASHIYMIDPANMVEGKQSYKLTFFSATNGSYVVPNTGQNPPLVAEAISVTAGNTYRLSFWFKDEAFGSVNRMAAWAYYTGSPGAGAQNGGDVTQLYSHSDTWKNQTYDITPPATVTHIRFWMGLRAGQNSYTGSIWFDNVQFTSALTPAVSDTSADTTGTWNIGSDNTPPAAVANLTAREGTNAGEVTLTWTAPGNDGNTGSASSYDVRYLTSAAVTETNWSTAVPVSGEPTPAAAGSAQTLTISLTAGGTYYFALKTKDGANNESTISNSVQGFAKSSTTPGDTTPSAPGTPTDDGATTTSTTQLRFSWTAATNAVKYLLCIGDTPGGTNVLNDRDVGSALTYTATGLVLTNGKTYYAKVKGVNSSGTGGPYSNNSDGIMVSGSVVPPPGPSGTPTEVKLYQPYPHSFNPKTGGAATIKYDVPEAAVVSIKVFNTFGELVKNVVDNADKQPGQYTEKWLGVNDGGETIASGVYIVHLKIDTNTQIQKVLVVK